MPSETNHIPLLIFAGALLAIAGTQAHGQTALYRSVGPDGRVTYSDRAAAGTRADARALPSASATPVAAALPRELREVARRFPVTLYTAKGCAPCADARLLLSVRGVPYSERTVASLEDIVALKALSGDQTLPFATLGDQHLKGFSDVEWKRWLDLAGYPKQSLLGADWRPAEPTPLVAVSKVAAPAPPDRTASAVAARPAPGPSAPDNPAGIRF